MTPWDILGIARTTDEREIRKAYARVLKTIDQELEPEKFIALREALDAARNEAYYASLEQEEEAGAEEDIFDNPDRKPTPEHLLAGALATAFKNLPPDALPEEADTPAQPETAQDSEHSIPLHQHGFEFLLDAIRQQNSQLDLRKELVDYVDYIQSLPPGELPESQAEAYLQQLDTACIQAGLNGLNDFLNIRRNRDKQPAYIDPAMPAQPLASNQHSHGHAPDNDLDNYSGNYPDNHPNNYPDHYSGHYPDSDILSLKAQEQQFKDKLDQLCHQLWNEQFDNASFATFQHCLKEWPEQSLDHQMATYDQLSYVLGSVQQYSDDSSRFLLAWYSHFGNDVPPASAEAALHRLHDRIEALLVEQQFWRNIPAKYSKRLHALKQGTPFKPISMLGLLHDKSSVTITHLRERNWLLPDMQSNEHNPNLHYLRICSHWQRFWLPMLLLCLSSLVIFSSTDNEYTPYLLTAGVMLSLLWVPFIQAPLQAWLYSRENHPQIFQRLSVGWYLGLAAILLLSPLLNQAVMLGLFWLYSLLSAFIMAHGLYRSSSLLDEFQQVIRIRTDFFVLYGGFIGVVFACMAVMELFAKDSITAPLSLILATPLIMALVIPSFIAEVLMQLIRSKRGLQFYWGICAVYGLLYLNSFVFEWTTWPVDLSEYTSFWLASFTLGFIWIPMALPPRTLVYVLKYATYTLVILMTLKLVIIALIMAYLLFQTIRADRQVWQNA